MRPLSECLSASESFPPLSTDGSLSSSAARGTGPASSRKRSILIGSFEAGAAEVRIERVRDQMATMNTGDEFSSLYWLGKQHAQTLSTRHCASIYIYIFIYLYTQSNCQLCVLSGLSSRQSQSWNWMCDLRWRVDLRVTRGRLGHQQKIRGKEW